MIDVGCPRLFACDECPIVSQLDYRLGIAEEYPDCGDFQFDHCGCDKVYDEFWQYGYCEDAWIERQNNRPKGVRKTGRAYRRNMRRKHIQKFRDSDRWLSGCHVGPYITGHWDDDDNWVLGSYIKYPHDSINKCFYKRVSNKKVRRSSTMLPKGNGYRRIFDYWWTIT